MSSSVIHPVLATDGEVIRYATGQCWLGTILVATSSRGVCAILFGEDAGWLAQDLQTRFPEAILREDRVEGGEHLAGVLQVVENPAQPAAVPLDLRGTSFQQRVWGTLRQIPAGETLSYGEIARRIGEPGMAREVAEACAANPLAVAVPCHRVVRAGGGISGYRWGVKRKRALLAREAA